MNQRRLAIALVHHPVLDAQGGTVTTAVTNLDVHDLARSATTYGCSDYFIAHPIQVQRELVQRICQHWTEGSSGRRIPDRRTALALVRVVSSLDEALERLGGRSAVEVWITAARNVVPPIGFDEARARLASDDPRSVLLVFGTGWGLAQSIIDRADAALAPIRSACSEYNHLSVRAACAIALDRLRGER